MTARDLLEVKSGFQGALWRLMKERVKLDCIELRASASRYIVTSMPDMVVREQMFMRANALEEFIDSFPHQIDEAYKEQLKKEQNE